MAQGTTITPDIYNGLQSRINTIMGVGSGDNGYGQSLNSSQVSSGNKILASQLSNLYTDMANARTHQINSVDVAVTVPTIGDKIVFANTWNKLDELMGNVEDDKLLIAPQQATAEVLQTSTRTSPWNGIITHTVRFTWPNANARRHFINASGELRASAVLTGGSGAKTNDWRNLLSNIGTIIMNRSQTVSTGVSQVTNIGLGNLTTSYQEIFRQFGGGVYTDNSYQVEARAPSTTTIDLRIRFRDDDTGNPLIDEDVDGTLVSSVGVLRATGTVQIPAPSTSNTETL